MWMVAIVLLDTFVQSRTMGMRDDHVTGRIVTIEFSLAGDPPKVGVTCRPMSYAPNVSKL